MRSTTTYNHRKRLMARIGDIFTFARLAHHTHEEIMDRVHTQVTSDPAWRRLPSYELGYLTARIDAEYEHVWRSLEWRIFYRGAYLPGAPGSARPEIPAGDWHRVDADKGAHFWPGTWHTYTSTQAFGPPVAELAHLITA